MKPSDLIIEVRDFRLERVGIILPKHAELQLTGAFNDVGSWQVTIQANHPMARYLRLQGYGLVVTDANTGKVLMSGPTTSSQLTEESDNGFVRKIVMSGPCDNIHLSDRLAFSNPSVTDENMTEQAQAIYDERTGSAETLIYQYVNANLGPGATSTRRLGPLTLGSSQDRGTVQTKMARYETLLELCQTLAKPDSLGFQIVHDYGNQGSPQLHFEVYQCANRTTDVRFAVSNRRLKQSTLQVDAPTATRVIVAVAEDKAGYVQVTTDDSRDAESDWHRRIETYAVGGGGKTVDSLTTTGTDTLADGGSTNIAAQAVSVDHTQSVYGVDWNMGDFVTIEVDGSEYETQVSGFSLVLDDEGDLQMGVVLGDASGLDVTSNMAARVESISTKVAALERNIAPQAMATFAAQTGSLGVPAGAMQMWAGTAATVPTGWLSCNGQAVSRMEYAALFAAIGTLHGAGDGSTTFNLPNMQGRFPMGADSGIEQGQRGGSRKIGSSNLPPHVHDMSHNHPQSNLNIKSLKTTTTGGSVLRVTDVGGVTGADGALEQAKINTPTYSGNTGNGSGTGLSNDDYLQPYVAFNFIIKT